MNKIQLLFTLCFTIISLSAFAQKPVHLKLSDNFPVDGEQISFTYNPKGTLLEGKHPSAAIYFFDNDKFPAVDAELVSYGKFWKGKFTVPANAKAFCIKLNDGIIADNNNGAGYVYLVHKNARPVVGAYASKAYLIGLTADMFSIKKNMQSSSSLYKKEFSLHPKLEIDYEDLYLLTLAYSTLADQQFATTRASILAASGNEKNMIAAYHYYVHGKKIKLADSVLHLIHSQFPDGEQSGIENEAAFTNENQLAKKDSLYEVLVNNNSWKAKNPANRQDYLLGQLAIAHLQQGDLKAYARRLAQVNDKTSLPDAMNETSLNWFSQGKHLNDAAQISAAALNLLDSLLVHSLPQPFQTPGDVKRNNRDSYWQCMDTYALVLFKENETVKARYSVKSFSFPFILT